MIPVPANVMQAARAMKVEINKGKPTDEKCNTTEAANDFMSAMKDSERVTIGSSAMGPNTKAMAIGGGNQPKVNLLGCRVFILDGNKDGGPKHVPNPEQLRKVIHHKDKYFQVEGNEKGKNLTYKHVAIMLDDRGKKAKQCYDEQSKITTKLFFVKSKDDLIGKVKEKRQDVQLNRNRLGILEDFEGFHKASTLSIGPWSQSLSSKIRGDAYEWADNNLDVWRKQFKKDNGRPYTENDLRDELETLGVSCA